MPRVGRPSGARWSHLQANAKQPTIGKTVDDAMVAIERDNPRLKSVLPKDYARPGLDKHRLGEIIDLIGGIDLIERAPSPQPSPSGRGSEEAHYRGGYDFSGLLKLAREMRKKQTPAEDLLWELLRDRQLCNAKFRRQHQFGDYLCDFYCHEAKLVVECDGSPHAKPDQIKHDAKRDAFLKAQGLTVLRFENQRVLNDTDAVLQKIAAHLPSPPGRGAGGEGRQGHDAPTDPRTHRSVDILGRVYEYFLTMFASAEGKNGGQFYTPSCVVRCLVEMLAPYKGRIYDPACGSGGMFVQSEKFVESHGGKLGDISIYGQESNATTRRLAIMNLAIRGIEADIGKEHADIRRALIEADLVDCMVALPGQLFYSTQIPVCLWFLRRDKTKPPTPNAASATAASKPSSSTPANSARSSTASTAS